MSRNALFAIVIIAILIVGLGIWYATRPPTPTVKKVTLTIASPEWTPGKVIEQYSKEEFTEYAKQYGYEVEIRFDYSPWGTYYQRLSSVFAAHSSEIDLAFSDSQWIGEFAEGGHIIKINDFLDKNPDLKKALLEDTLENILLYYCVYPRRGISVDEVVDLAKQGKVDIWGVPGTADSNHPLFYRKDLFTHPEERAAFKAKYGYDLPQTYEDWKKVDWVQVRDFAEFFTRKKGEKLAGEVLEEDFYGIVLINAKDYDYISCFFLDVFWSWGAELWDEETMTAEGYVNSPQAKEAARFYMELVKYMPPGAPSIDYDALITTFAEGRAAMTSLWSSMAGIFFDPSASKVADKIGVAVMPHHNGVRYTVLGGQPLVVSAYSKNQEVALLYLKWFYSDDVQKKLALDLGFTARKSILNTPEFMNSHPWTQAYVENAKYAKDFWNIPLYSKLLEAQQEILNAMVAGQIPPDEAMDLIAQRHEEILKEAKGG